MWLFELLGLTVVVGTVGGLVWRYTEDFLERRANRQQLELDLVDDAASTTQSMPVVSTTKSN
jgi:hypothetical protein